MSNLFYLFKIINHHQILELLTVITTIDPNEQIELNEPSEEQDESGLFIEEEDPFPRGVFLGDPWPVPPSPSSDLSELNKPNLAPSEGKFVGNSFRYGFTYSDRHRPARHPAPAARSRPRRAGSGAGCP